MLALDTKALSAMAGGPGELGEDSIQLAQIAVSLVPADGAGGRSRLFAAGVSRLIRFA